MATTLATAWLNIVPSMKGVSAAVNAGFGNVNGTSIGNKIGSQLKLGVASGSAGTGSKVEGEIGAVDGSAAGAAVGNRFGAMFTKVAAAIGTAAIGAKILDLGKTAFQAYSDFEQLSGGVAKLYGNMGLSVEQYAAQQNKSVDEVSAAWQRNESAQATVMANSQKAWKSCGMSANDYMEQATTFSAALINSLGGDTQKAADMTDTAMKAMSDNINTFGSNAEDVQNAFNGFAKQNYTMLDNLKLGYGGTKDEMERLIKDANEWGAANGKASDLSIDSFADIITAIDQIQQKQQIAGTTAREAASTIEGSINSMKAAWSNWLGELGKSDGNISARTQELISSTVTVAENALPRIAQIVAGVFSAIGLGGLADQITNFANNFDKITNKFSGVLSWANQAKSAIDNFFTAFANTGAFQAFDNLAQSVGNALGGIWTAATNVLGRLGELVGFDAASWGAVAGNAFKTLADWASSIADNVTKISDWCTANSGAVTTALVAIGAALAVFKVASIIETVSTALAGFDAAARAAAIGQTILNAAMNANPFVLITSLIAGVVAGLVYFFTQTETGKQTWANFCSAMSSAWSAVCSFFSSALNNVKTWFSNTGNAISNVWNSVISFVSGVPGRIVNFFSSLPGRVIGFFQSIPSRVTSIDWGGVGRNVVHGIANGISKFGSVIVTNILGAAKNALNAVKNFFGIHSPSRVMRDQVGKYVALGMAKGIDGYASSGVDAMRDAAGSIVGAGQDVLSGFDPSVQLQSDLSKTGRANMASAIDSQLTIPSKSDPNAMTYEQMVEALKTALDAQDTTIVLDTGVVAGSVNRRLGTNMNRGL